MCDIVDTREIQEREIQEKFISQSNDMYIIMYKCITEYYYDYNGNGRSTITYIGCLPDAPGILKKLNGQSDMVHVAG